MLKKGEKGKDILNSWQDYASTLTLVHMGTLYWKGHGIQNNPYNLALIPLPDFKTTSQYNNISSPRGKLKKWQGEWTKAPHFGNIKRSPAELWQSGNPWQCDFCYLLCIKSRCQEPSPPQPRGRGRIHPAPACPIFCLQRPPRHSGDVQQLQSQCDLERQMRPESNSTFISNIGRVGHCAFETLKWELRILLFLNTIKKNDCECVCYGKWQTVQTFCIALISKVRLNGNLQRQLLAQLAAMQEQK